MLTTQRISETILDALSAQIAILDRAGNILQVNKSWRKFGLANGLIDGNFAVGMNYLTVCDEAAAENVQDAVFAADGIRSVIRGDIKEYYQEYSGDYEIEKRWFAMRVTRSYIENDLFIVVAHEDISALRNAEIALIEQAKLLSGRVQELHLNESRLSSLLELSQMTHRLEETEIVHEAVEFAVRLTSSKIGYLHFVNPDQKTLRLVTWSNETLKTCTAVHESHYPVDQAGVWADCVRTKKPVIHNDYQSLPDKRGYPEGHAHLIRHASVPLFDDGLIRLILGVGNKAADYDSADILQMTLIGDQLVRMLQRKRTNDDLIAAKELLEKRLVEIVNLQSQLQEQAIRDYLTGLYNRRYLDETLAQELTKAMSGSSQVSMIVMDIDHFKGINDAYGHQAGDEVLIALGKLLAQNIRSSDIACRQGGDEFVVVMPNTSSIDAYSQAEKWRKSFAEIPFLFAGQSVSIKISMGIATFPAHSTSSKGLFRAADQALYQSKLHHNKVTISTRNPTGFLARNDA